MPIITVKLQTPVRRTFRVEQIAGMFDVPCGQVQGPKSNVQSQKTTTLDLGPGTLDSVSHELTAEVPGLDEPWTIGAIVGPSGSGKTTLAKAAFGSIYKPRAWPKNRALIDCFPDVPVKDLARALASAGLGSPPTWLKTYGVLSGGEKFRAELFRALAKATGVVVFDEFSALLDRTVAKTASAAFARLLRYLDDSATQLRFVAVTCHTDLLPWLSPDWVVELGVRSNTQSPMSKVKTCESAAGDHRVAAVPVACASGLCARLTRGRPRRPGLRFRVERVPQSLWTRFSGEHYLSGGLAASATCYAAYLGTRPDRTATTGRGSEPIGFCAVVAALGWKGAKRIQRLVVLPEFQGLGVGGKLLDAVAAMEAAKGFRVTITASHPAILVHCSHSERWRYLETKKLGSTPQVMCGREIASSVGRAVASFEFVVPQNRNVPTDQHRLS